MAFSTLKTQTDFIMVLDDLTFEKWPAKSPGKFPEYEKLLCRISGVPDYREAEILKFTEVIRVSSKIYHFPLKL